MSLELANKTGRQAGTWHLDTFVRASHDRADYIATNGDRRARVELMLADSEEAEQSLSSWETARKLSHENLIQIYDCGEITIDGARFVYSASELPDDDLGEILADRSLELDEAREMTSATANALAYLHGRSLQLGAVSAPNMMIVGQSVKLGAAGIAPAGEHGRQSDLQQLGMTLLQAFGGSSASEARRLPHPFDSIVNGCLDPVRSGWTAETVLDALTAKTAAVEPSREIKEPVEQVVNDGSGSGRWKLVAVGAAALALAGFTGYRLLSRSEAPPQQAASTTAAVKPAPPVQAPTVIVPERAAIPFKSASRKATPKTAETGSADRETKAPVERERKSSLTGSNWGVIAATYNSQDAAQGRANRLAKHSSALHPRVFHPGPSNRYFVVLGAGMTQEDATKLLHEATRHGAPADSYVTRLGEGAR